MITILVSGFLRYKSKLSEDSFVMCILLGIVGEFFIEFMALLAILGV